MDRSVAERPIGCRERVAFVILYGHIIKWRCREKTCSDCRRARQAGMRTYHLFDQDTDHQWTEFEPGSTGRE